MNDNYSNSEIGSNIICPYCGKEYEPSYEDTWIGGDSVNCYEEGDQGTFTCDDCGKRFKLYSTFTWEYETETIWDKVILSNGFYNFSVSKTDIYYRLEVEVPSGI